MFTIKKFKSLSRKTIWTKSQIYGTCSRYLAHLPDTILYFPKRMACMESKTSEEFKMEVNNN